MLSSRTSAVCSAHCTGVNVIQVTKRVAVTLYIGAIKRRQSGASPMTLRQDDGVEWHRIHWRGRRCQRLLSVIFPLLFLNLFLFLFSYAISVLVCFFSKCLKFCLFKFCTSIQSVKYIQICKSIKFNYRYVKYFFSIRSIGIHKNWSLRSHNIQIFVFIFKIRIFGYNFSSSFCF